MKRSTPLRADPEATREWIDRSRRKQAEAQKRGAGLKRSGIRPVNRKRKARLHEKQFGDKSRWVRERYPRCEVTGEAGSDFLPVDHAHVLGTRGAGADSSGIVPLWRPVHIDFDGSMTDERFAIKWPRTREWIRERAREIHAEWGTP